MEFDEWLKTVCFQEPTPEAYDLAKSAWKAAIEGTYNSEVNQFSEFVEKSARHMKEFKFCELSAVVRMNFDLPDTISVNNKIRFQMKKITGLRKLGYSRYSINKPDT